MSAQQKIKWGGTGQIRTGEFKKPVNKSETKYRNKLKQEKPYVYKKIMNYAKKVERGESIAIVRLVYDYTCNFNCVHCCERRIDKRKRRFFTLKDVKELSRQADEMGLAQFVITGGEPLTFPDFDDLVKAIDPQKFWIVSDTNGWFLDEKRAKHLKSIGLDKIQLSLDSLSAAEHDAFRRRPGSHARSLKAIDAALKAGLNIIVQTVVWKQRVRSKEFVDFLKFLNGKGVGVYISYAKPVGGWEGKFDALVDKDDMDYIRRLEKKYNVFTHLTPAYGLDFGCISVKRMISITKYGDVMPCPYIYISLGNFFKEPLKDIVQRGLKIKWFGNYCDTCLVGEDRHFIKKYITKTYGKSLPVPYSKIFTDEDFIEKKSKRRAK